MPHMQVLVLICSSGLRFIATMLKGGGGSGIDLLPIAIWWIHPSSINSNRYIKVVLEYTPGSNMLWFFCFFFFVSSSSCQATRVLKVLGWLLTILAPHWVPM